jgi:EAL domain-containing protein (putative c-di-GMP-specific phosphodiesterase class I)
MGELTLLDGLLKPGGLRPMFQPIFEFHGRTPQLHSLECLARGSEGVFRDRANILFDYVRRKRAEIAVDRACIRMMLGAISLLPFQTPFSVNVHATTLARDSGFLGFLKELAEEFEIAPRRMMIELVEEMPFWDVAAICRALDDLRALGVRIAVDDVGAGQSNFNHILDCRPDAFKIDAYLVKGCGSDKHRLAVLQSIAALARSFGAQVIAEGVENEEDLGVLLDMEIHLVQGFLLARPMSAEALLESGLLVGNEFPAPRLAPDMELGFGDGVAEVVA